MKKKIITMLLTCSMVASVLSACGDSENSLEDKARDITENVKDDKKDNAKAEAVLEGSQKKEEAVGYEQVVVNVEADKSMPTPILEPAPMPTKEPAPVFDSEPAPMPTKEPAPVFDSEPAPMPAKEPAPEPTSAPILEPTPVIALEPTPDTVIGEVIIDPATGMPYDLGGMEIIVRDWWSDPDRLPANEYERAREAYIDRIEETYNFTIKQMAISDWGSAPVDFIDYVTTGGDDKNYLFVLRQDPAVVAAMYQGLLYDLNTLDCLDFSEPEFQRNKLHEQYTLLDSTYAMYRGYSEPRTGVYFNKRLLEEAGINPESIYDMQANGTWTWQAWTDMMDKVQRDIDNDGVIDVYGFDANYSMPVSSAVFSNASEYVGMENGMYKYMFEDPNTVLALKWITACFHDYALVRPTDAQWDYYKSAFVDGECAFMVEDAYCGNSYGWLTEMTDDVGFVMFPKGPAATDYVNRWSNNCVAIPGCYEADRAWKIAFAYNLYTDDVPGYENYVDLSYYRNGIFDSRAINETLTMMVSKGMITYHEMVPNLDIAEPFLWRFYADTNVDEVLARVREQYMACIGEANARMWGPIGEDTRRYE